jgi:hypothetical protein
MCAHDPRSVTTTSEPLEFSKRDRLTPAEREEVVACLKQCGAGQGIVIIDSDTKAMLFVACSGTKEYQLRRTQIGWAEFEAKYVFQLKDML